MCKRISSSLSLSIKLMASRTANCDAAFSSTATIQTLGARAEAGVTMEGANGGTDVGIFK